MNIIDFHVHPMYDFHLPTHGVTIDTTRFREDLEQNGITRCCGSVIYSAMNNQPLEAYEQLISKLNDQALLCREKMEGFYIPGIHVHPAFVDLSCRELKRCHEQGVKLIGELVPYMMKWPEYTCDGFIEIMEYARELDMVVNMHPTTPADMFAFCEAVPKLKIVWAHLSGYNAFEEHLKMLKRYENVYFDISAHGLDRDAILRYTIDQVGYERLLFGTDYPGIGPAADIAGVMYEQLTTCEREAIFYKNAERLLAL